MNRTDFWKNFRLGEELSISGTFIYNGLRRFHEMRKLDFDDEVFDMLYNLAVGIERLLKIVVVLLEHDERTDQERLERSLVTHNHLDLLRRVRVHRPLNFGQPHIDFLGLLSDFYNTHRYERFSLSSAQGLEREISALCRLLTKHLDAEFPDDHLIFGRFNEDRYRRFVRRTCLKICRTLYDVVKHRARDLNLYTYELRHASKAESVFLREVDIADEDVLWKELLLFLMNTHETSKYIDLLRGIEPLEFDPEEVSDYLDCFRSDSRKAYVLDTLEHFYAEMGKEERNERLQLINLIGDPNLYLHDEDGEDDDGT